MRTLRLALLALGTCLSLALPTSASADREIPVGLANTNDQNLRSPDWLYSIRFVLDRDTTMHRFISGFKAKGASWDEHSGAKCSGPGSGCYGGGDGGRIQARLVTVEPDGTPDLSNVLAEETVDPRQRYAESKAAYDLNSITQFWYWNLGGVRLRGDTPYAMVYRNVHPDPGRNFSSTNSPVTKESEAGPNGRNNLDPDARGAIAGLDPREAVAWSTNGGSSWSWGRQVGHYFGSSTSDDGTRLPWYGWQTSATAKPESNQPYYNYWGRCSPCTLTARSVPRRTTLTEAGGYAPVGAALGTVTVRNTRTGETGRTAALGEGLERGRLDRPVTVEVGDTYEISSTGTAYKSEADGFIVGVFGVGSGLFPFTTLGQGSDRAELFALPHPYFAAAGAEPGPAPAPVPAPTPAPTPPPEAALVSSGENLARGRAASASTFERAGLEAGSATDGDTSTRWSSQFLDHQWWYVDLGTTRTVDRLSVLWEGAFARRYRVVTSLDGRSWSTAAEASASAKGWRNTSFAARRARYVGVRALERGTEWGVSFYELRVGARPAPAATPSVRAATSVAPPRTTAPRRARPSSRCSRRSLASARKRVRRMRGSRRRKAVRRLNRRVKRCRVLARSG